MTDFKLTKNILTSNFSTNLGLLRFIIKHLFTTLLFRVNALFTVILNVTHRNVTAFLCQVTLDVNYFFILLYTNFESVHTISKSVMILYALEKTHKLRNRNITCILLLKNI